MVIDKLILLVDLTKKNERICSHEDFSMNIHSSLIHNRQKLFIIARNNANVQQVNGSTHYNGATQWNFTQQ